MIRDRPACRIQIVSRTTKGFGFIQCGRLPGSLGGHDGLSCLGQAERASQIALPGHIALLGVSVLLKVTRQCDAEEAVVEVRRLSILCGRLNRDPLDGVPVECTETVK
jgi:hypothetical protein